MGNYLFVTRPPETAAMSTAPLRTPFSDVTAPIGHRYSDEECFPFQLRWIDCCEAYGREMAKEKCKYHYQDFIECSRKWKQRARCSAMMEQHYHLWYKGITGAGPKRELYNETPRYDGYSPRFKYEDTQYKS